MPVVSILCPWCQWAMVITGSLDEATARARAREAVIEHAASDHPDRIDEAAREHESWTRSEG